MATASKFDAKVEFWKNNLLDLSRRNRQLYYLPESKNAIECLTPVCGDLFNTLVVSGKTHTFIPVFKAEKKVREKKAGAKKAAKVTKAGKTARTRKTVEAPCPEKSAAMTASEENLSQPPQESAAEILKESTETSLGETRIEASGQAPEFKPGETAGNGGTEASEDAEMFYYPGDQGEVSSKAEAPAEDLTKTPEGNLHLAAIEKAKARARSTDIVTKHDDDTLARHLRRTSARAKTFLEEQGVQTLYVTFGLLKWYEPGEKEPVYSPLLFAAVKLYRESVLDPFKLILQDDDVILNPALVEKFHALFHLKVPDFPDEFDTETLLTFIEQLKLQIVKEPTWELQARSFVGLFMFAKLALYNDLVQYRESLRTHPLVKAIAEGGGYKEPESNIPTPDELGDNIEPADIYAILDADSSQAEAIQYAKKGASMVIQGPPGTGKSQGISNIIAECLVAGKKVLFVAEKMAALEVVKKRLDKVGVGEFCLELHAAKSNKADVLKQIDKSLRAELISQQVEQSKYENLKILRQKLNEYVQNLHTPLGATNQSIFQKMQELVGAKDVPSLGATFKDPLSLTEQKLFEIKDLLAQLEGRRSILEKYTQNPWVKTGIVDFPQGYEEQITPKLNAVVEGAPSFQQNLDAFQERFGMVPITTTTAYTEVATFLDQHTPQAFTADIDDLLHQFNTHYANALRYFKPSFYEARKGVNACLTRPILRGFAEHLTAIKTFKEHYLKSDVKSSYQEIKQAWTPVKAQYDALTQQVQSLRDLFVPAVTKKNAGDTDWQGFQSTAQYWLDQMPSLPDWTAIQAIGQKMLQLGAGTFFNKLKNLKVQGTPLPDLFQKDYAEQWLKHAERKFPSIQNFNAQYHIKNRDDFVNLDKVCMKINQYRICERLMKERPSSRVMADVKTSEEGILKRELIKKRNIMPLRKLISSTRNFLTTMKPCFMMSPLSVASFLPAAEFAQYFDMVVFDEASQICPEDAIGAIARGKQLVVVGDRHQLPPTRFFSTTISETWAETEEDLGVFDSILDECCGIGLPEVLLNWHYRSRKEGLIAYSNYNYYGSRLNTFPDLLKTGTVGAADVDQLSAIEFHYLPNATYDKGKTRKNRTEAEEVAKAIIAHYEANKSNSTRFSLGVVTFSEAQQDAVETELEKIYRAQPELESLVNSYDEEPFFIKNLENVQGDERDFIFFSIGYGKDETGKMTSNFGPINKSGGERRLNVAISRARFHVKVFCSFLPGDVIFSSSESTGFRQLMGYLEYARTGQLEQPAQMQDVKSQPFQRYFEDDVRKSLEAAGYKVDTLVGKSAYRIDLAVVDPKDPSRYILGIECDGESYRSAKTARDRDIQRPSVLIGLGWGVHHIWSPTWFANKDAVVAEVKEKVEQILADRAKPKKPAVAAPEKSPEPIPSRPAKPGEPSIPSATKPTQQAITKLVNKTQAGVSSPSISTPQPAESNKKTPQQVATNPENITQEGAVNLGSVEPKVIFTRKETIEEKVSGVEKRSVEFRQGYLSLPWIREYQQYQTFSPLTPDAFYENARQRKKTIDQIIAQEGPIHRDLLIKRILAAYDIKRRGPKINDILDATLGTDEFFYPADFEGNYARICVDHEADPRKFQQVSPPEFQCCLLNVANQAYTIEKKDLFLKVVQILGFTSVQAEYAASLEKDLAQLASQKLVEIFGEQIKTL